MSKSVSEKIGVKEHMRAVLINAPQEALQHLNSPLLTIQSKPKGEYDYIHLFTETEASFHQHFPELISHLKPAGMFWVSWPKAGKQGTDLNIKTVIKLGYDYGLVESKCISINETWPALKFTWPKENQQYNNSYGKLK